MLSIDEWLDEKPYKELYDGTIHKKVSPGFPHGIVEGLAHSALLAWGAELGAVVIELRIYLDEGLTLVPDVSFVSNERLAALSEEDENRFPIAPDIVVEVRSSGDRTANIRRKTDLYLRHGTRLVLNVDPRSRSVIASTAAGERTFGSHDVVEDPGFPTLSIPVSRLFDPLDRLPLRGASTSSG